MEIIMRIQVCPIRWISFDSKENGGNLFLQNEGIKTMHPNEKNVLIVLNHHKNGDYYENPNLAILRDENLILRIWRKKTFLSKLK